MKKKDLLELLRSTIEEDAIVSRIYYFFHIERGYTIEELDRIIEHGKTNGIFKIDSVNNTDEKYSVINWCSDNVEQEIIISDEYRKYYINSLFSEDPKIPEIFKNFVN